MVVLIQQQQPTTNTMVTKMVMVLMAVAAMNNGVEAFTLPVQVQVPVSSVFTASKSSSHGIAIGQQQMNTKLTKKKYTHTTYMYYHKSPTQTQTQTQTQSRTTQLYQTKKEVNNSKKQEQDESLTEILLNKYEDEIDEFCKSTYNFWKQTVIPPVRDYVEIQKLDTKGKETDKSKDFISKLIGPPELPGVPREVWFVILASIPTGLIWYGYYKFSIEEELYHLELESDKGKVTGFGGYGTLFPFVYGIIIGFPLSFLPGTPGPFLVQLASFWILASQVNLYRRVNELCMEEGVKDKLGLDVDDHGPLYEWWALLPPPLDVVVGLRQIHFLSEYWRIKRGEEYSKDIVAEDLFPFIAWNEKITLKQFFRTPSKWFWFTKDMKDFEYEFLKD
mmetsp:Transcript_16435/g.20796  ORF Transcript_16435/g.20796 Transcript_16435/m.20796 type:complete len:390 (+) Transcript_16435:50-1219(+)|eukprot:CAMPEP_0203669430 /NCGR_PEP_ID=MMETSP0090-20130426/5817_1 /ASSEMBLY_ACC=CAM_ASM_001088 /TAXON_ID=426623 /ORGANISM="Chaetoceros affinis, Strain CCMP159" /LENGTH=389 /DNA_ID=CAMNT_0050534125 /DNA_START=16 /DNA_END=1185 /DNA_ORIENTATION=+